MNTIIKTLLYLAKALNAWLFIIPAKFSILALLAYFGILKLIFGTYSMIKISDIVGGGAPSILICLFFGIPIFWAFTSCFSGHEKSASNSINENIDSVINHRNNMMRNTDSKNAYEIMKKTAHLDVIRSNPYFKNALMGFNATTGIKGPTSTYKNLIEK